MAITLDQKATLLVAGGTSFALTWAVNPTAGSKVLCACTQVNKLIPTSIVDNGTTPTNLTLDASYQTASRNVLIYRGDNITLPSTGSYKVTFTYGSATGGAVHYGSTYLGVKTGAAAGSNNGSATGTAVSSGAATPTAAGALFFAAFADASGLNPETITLTGTGFTQEAVNTNGSANVCSGFADKIDAAGPTATACTWTLGDSVLWQSAIATYDAIPALLPQGLKIRRPLSREPARHLAAYR